MDRRSPIGPIKKLGRLKDRLKKTRYWTYLWVSISKILIFIARYVKFDICKFKKKDSEDAEPFLDCGLWRNGGTRNQPKNGLRM